MGRKQVFGVIGLGNFGRSVAGELTRFGNDVIGVDCEARVVDDMVESLARAIIADARDPQALREAGMDKCDVILVSVGTPLEASVLALMNARMLGVPQIWAKASSRMHHRILSKLGADRVIHPEQEMGLRVAQMLHNPQVRDYVSVGNGFHVVNFIAPETLEGRNLAQLDLLNRFDLRCLGVMRGSAFIGSDTADCTLAADDKILLLGTRDNLWEFGASLL